MKRKWWIVGILVFVELLVCGGILLTLWVGRTAFGGIRFFYSADTHLEETLEKTFVVDGPAVLDLEAEFGDVTVTGSEGDEVQVIAELSLWGADEEDARRQVDVQMTQDGNRVNVRVVRPEWTYVGFASTRGPRVDFEIRVPSETSLQLVTSSGDLTVSSVTGTAKLETSFGNIEVEAVSGPVSAQSDSGDITFIGLSHAGDLEVETNFGQLVLRDITAHSLTARSDSGDVQVDGVILDGALDLRTNFGSVTVRDVAAERLTARSDSGDIQVEDATLDGPLDLETNFGKVTANGVRATSYRLKSDSGGLTLDGCRGPLDLQTNFGDIEVKNATEATPTLKTDSGRIYFSGSLHDQGVHRVENGLGQVHLVLPADAAFDLDAETDFGSIKTGFAVMMTEFEEKHIVGEVNGGGPLLQIHTDSGDITLESVTVEPTGR
jgi:DUF4097 and DUF4098 domain-containing protein YvlB